MEVKPNAKRYQEIIHDGPPMEPIRKKKLPFSFKLIRSGFQLFSPIFPKWSVDLAYKFFTTPMIRARHNQTDAVLEKVKISEFVYKRQLLKLYQWGEAEKTVLLVHGWQSRGTALRSFVPGLLALGYQVATFDGPAHGDSPGKRMNLPVFSGAIHSLLNRFGNVHAIIGHSFGGGSTLYSLMEHEQKKSLPRLVLVAAPVNVCTVVENYTDQIRLGKKAKALYLEKISEKMGRPFSDGDANRYFDKLPIGKTLIVHDKGDQELTFAMSKDFFDRQENVEMIATEGMGHFKIMKHPAVIKNVLEFLDN